MSKFAEHPYDGYKLYGPYIRPDNRMHIILIKLGRRITVSWPKYLLEVKFGRILRPDEEANHIDGNVTNNHITNLEIINSTEHRKLHKTKYQDEEIRHCIRCKREVVLTREQIYDLNSNIKRGKSSGVHCKDCWDAA